jgi:hypothetical protein
VLIPRRPVKRRRDGRFEINLPKEEREVLASQLEDLRDLLLGDAPLLTRLFPTAYPDDPERDREYQQLMRGQLLESHFAAIETMEATIDADVIDEAELTQWMHTINALRLVLGTALDISEDDADTDIDPDDPRFDLNVLYRVLTWLLGWIVDALSAALPPPSDDAPPPSPADAEPAVADLEALDELTDLEDLEDLEGFQLDDEDGGGA